MPDNLFYLKREKILVDSSVYINHLNHGLHSDTLRELIRRHTVYLHSVVFEELLAGIRDVREKQLLMDLKKPFLASDRMLTPNDADWQEAGLIVNKLLRKGNLPAHKVVSLTHDVLIAVSSCRLGIRVITENKRDFERIRAFKPVKFSILSSGFD